MATISMVCISTLFVTLNMAFRNVNILALLLWWKISLELWSVKHEQRMFLLCLMLRCRIFMTRFAIICLEFWLHILALGRIPHQIYSIRIFLLNIFDHCFLLKYNVRSCFPFENYVISLSGFLSCLNVETCNQDFI